MCQYKTSDGLKVKINGINCVSNDKLIKELNDS